MHLHCTRSFACGLSTELNQLQEKRLTQSDDSYSGRCMCGRLSFSFSGKPRFVSECVCDSCRRAHGASVVGWVGVKSEQFRIDSGETDLSWYKSSDPSERGFCTRCGTRLFFRSTLWSGEVHMALANFDQPHDLTSAGLSFKDEFPHWSAVTEKEEISNRS